MCSTALKAWREATQRKDITMVTAGRSGVGKTTLIHNLLKIEDKTDKCKKSSSIVTRRVELLAGIREEVMVKMLDMPDISTKDVDHEKAMAELQEMTGGKCDMLLYCVSLLPDSKVDKVDEMIIKMLTLVFGKDVWKHTILVLTFSNAVKVLYPERSIQRLVDEYAKKFQLVLMTICPTISVVSVFSLDSDKMPQSDSSTFIVAMPAGNGPYEQYMDNLQTVRWDENVFGEILRKSNAGRNYPVALKATPPIMPFYVRLPVLFGMFVLRTAVPTAIGTATFVYIGTAVGRLLGQFVTRHESSIIFNAQRLSVMIGVAVVGSWAVLQIMPDLQKYEREQSQLERVQGKLKGMRRK